MEGSGAVQNDLPAGSGSKIVNSKNSVKKQEPEVEKGQKELEFKAQNLQNKIYVMRLVGELWESSAIGEFIQDLTNNNLSLGVIGDRKVIRGFLREQGRKLVLRYQEDYAAVLEKYESLTDTIKQGNLTWNQVNIEIAYLEKSILERKVLKEDVLGVYDPNLTTLCKRIESSKFIRQPKGPIGSCFSILVRPFFYTLISPITFPLKALLVPFRLLQILELDGFELFPGRMEADCGAHHATISLHISCRQSE